MPLKLAAATAVFLLIMFLLEVLRSKYILGVTHADIVMPDLPKEFVGMKIALIADLHQMRFSQYNEELAKRIKLQEPDYIFFAGDMGDSRKFNVDAFYDLMEVLGDDIPMIAVPGNHDLRLGGGGIHRNFAAECEKAGVILLHNNHIDLKSGDTKLYIYGYCQDLKSGHPHKNNNPKNKKSGDKKSHLPLKKVTNEDLREKLGECPNDAPVLLIAHDATGFKKYARWGAKIIFSGHIHGGLIRLPILGGLLSPDRVFFPKYSAGLYKHSELRDKESQMYVTRGLGSGQLFRFFNPPEIAILTLTDSAAATPVIHKAPEKTPLSEAIKTESASLRELLGHRSDQVSDFFAKITGADRKYSKYSRVADERKKRNTYTADDYRKRMGLDEDERKGNGKSKKKGKRR